MKLANVETTEITVIAVYVLTCYMCDKQLHLATEDCSVGDVAFSAATQGWHSYQTADESCSTACPKCIKEVQENEAEAGSCAA